PPGDGPAARRAARRPGRAHRGAARGVRRHDGRRRFPRRGGALPARDRPARRRGDRQAALRRLRGAARRGRARRRAGGAAGPLETITLTSLDTEETDALRRSALPNLLLSVAASSVSSILGCGASNGNTLASV